MKSGRLLLVTGTPGTGKRSLGNFLALTEGFVHLDFDSPRSMGAFLGGGIDGLVSGLEANTRPGQDVVITWTSVSTAELPYVRILQSRGYEWAWIDSDRGAACATHLSIREDNPRRPRFLNTFESDGRFRPLYGVACDLLERQPAERPVRAPARQPRRVRTPQIAARSGSHRALFGVGVGFATMAAASAVAFVALGGGSGPKVTNPFGTPAALAASKHLVQPHGSVPTGGVLVSDTSFAGVRLGDTEAQVRALWGAADFQCPRCQVETWMYVENNTGNALTTGVVFSNGRVINAFTTSLTGDFPRNSDTTWKTTNGLYLGQSVNQQLNDMPGTWSGSTRLIPVPGGKVSVMMQGSVITGFTLSVKNVPASSAYAAISRSGVPAA